MSRFQGGLIGSVANTPNGTAYTGRANGVWTLPHHIAAKSALLWAIGQTRPNAPSIGTATGLSGTSVSVAFIPPVVSGGSTITVYTVTSSGGQVATGTSSPIVVTGLTAGTSYTFTVTATNDIGTSVSSSASNSVVPQFGDPYYSSVSLFLNGNGTNNSAVFSDLSSTPKAITVYGNSVSSTTRTQFNTTSMYFDGTGDYVTLPSSTNLLLNGVDFTIECWIYPTRAAGTGSGAGSGLIQSIITQGDGWWSGGIQGNYFLHINNTGIACSAIASGAVGYTGAVTIDVNAWQHIAVVKSGTTISGYKNGVFISSQTGCTDFGSSTSWINNIGVGNFGDSKIANYFQGYIDDLRITKGIARYTASFTPSPFPPTAALVPQSALVQGDPHFSSVSLLLSGDSFTDLSSSPKTITNNGSVAINTTTKKYGTGSMYFNGTNQSLTFASSATFAFGTADFTIECWYYPVTRSSTWPSIWGNTEGYPTNCFAMNDRHNQHQSVFSVTIGNYQPNNEVAIIGSITVVDKVWYHLAVVRSGTSIKMYVNGVLDGSITYSGSVDNNSAESWFIGGATSAWVNAYINDFRITKGVARYTANFTPPVTPHQTASFTELPIDPALNAVSLLVNGETTDVDANWSNVSLMLTGDDFIDWSNQHNTITNNGTVTLSTVNKKFNASSYSFSGSNYLSIPYSTTLFNWWASDFTLEFWINPTSLSSCQVTPPGSTFVSNLIGNTDPTGTTNYWSFGPIASGAVVMYYYNGSANHYQSTETISQGEWSHIALTKNSSGFQIWVNGVGNGYTAITGTPQSSTGVNLTIGKYLNGSFNGQIADLRITKGVARTITVPTTALPSFKILDRSTKNIALTPYGNVQISSTQKKYGNTSLYFDGTGDYLTSPSSAQFAIGTGDFTAEAWIYKQSTNRLIIFGLGVGGLSVAINTSGNIELCRAYQAIEATFTASISNNTWTHIAVVRSGTNVSAFKDGVFLGTSTVSTSYVQGMAYIGVDVDGTSTPFNGYIDDLRITKGVARYVSNFIPPTIALPLS